MNAQEFEDMKRAQRRDLAFIVAAAVVLFFLARATMPDPIQVETGPGWEVVKDGRG